ncbi:SCO family protein [Telluria sp. B2]
MRTWFTRAGGRGDAGRAPAARSAALGALLLALALVAGGQAARAAQAQGLSGLPPLGYLPPAPGTYRLERIMKAPEGVVLESDGSVRRLSEFTTGRITLFSFIYTYCTDAKGCPLAYATLHSLKQTIEQTPTLRGKVRFVSMSFDPEHDTPVMMRSYGGSEARDRRGLDWHFLTTRNGRELAPILDGFGQDVSVAAPQVPGQRLPVLSHMLKVYLLDSGGTVREIYSTSYLHPQVLLGDIRPCCWSAPSPGGAEKIAFLLPGVLGYAPPRACRFDIKNRTRRASAGVSFRSRRTGPARARHATGPDRMFVRPAASCRPHGSAALRPRGRGAVWRR